MKGRIKMASGMSKQVYRLLLKKGFDEELSREIAFTYMNTDVRLSVPPQHPNRRNGC